MAKMMQKWTIASAGSLDRLVLEEGDHADLQVDDGMVKIQVKMPRVMSLALIAENLSQKVSRERAQKVLLSTLKFPEQTVPT